MMGYLPQRVPQIKMLNLDTVSLMPFHEVIFKTICFILWDIRANKQSPNFDEPTVFILHISLWILINHELVAKLCIFLLRHFKYSFCKWQVELVSFLSVFPIWKLSTNLSAFIRKCKACSLNVTRPCANHLNTF